MRSKLIVRFVLTYLLVAFCIRALSGTAEVMARWLGAAWHVGSPSPLWPLQLLSTQLWRELTGILLPVMDEAVAAGLVVSAGILLAGAVLFARGPVKDYRKLCEKVSRLSRGTEPPVVDDTKGEPDLERRLDAIAARIAVAEDSLRTQRARCQDAKWLLDAARAQIDVLVESGAFAEGSGEAGLVQDALSNLRKAQSKIV